MTQVVSVLMVLTGLSIQIARFHSQSRGGFMRETNIPVQELWLKLGGGLMRERGHMGGILWYWPLLADKH